MKLTCADGAQDSVPIFSSLGSIPAPLTKPDAAPAEYPSVHALSPTTYVVSDGCGRLYPLLVHPSSTSITATLGSPYTLSDPSSGELLPFKIEWVGNGREVLVSAVKRERTAAGAAGKEKGWRISLVRFPEDWVDSLGSEAESPLEILWSLEGLDAPVFADFADGRFLLASSAPFASSAASSSSTSSAQPAPRPSLSSRPPQAPFTWVQSTSSITLSIPLPPSTVTSHIHVPFSTSFLSISLGSPTLRQALPGFDRRPFWDAIKPSDSTWTWDSATGVLELELEKAHAGTRWPSLFKSSREPGQEDYEEVPETLSEDKKAAIRESLEKFTSDEGVGGMGGIGAAAGFSSLMDVDDELTAGGEDGEEEAAGGMQVLWTFVETAGEGEVRVTSLPGSETLLGGSLRWTQEGFGGRSGRGMEPVLLTHSVSPSRRPFFPVRSS